ncbi:MAG: ABC transporter ATP-binding protein [Actinomycetota bacterium]
MSDVSVRSQPLVICRGLHKRFGDTVALDGFDLEVLPGELLVLLGPSGCGKSTALRLIVGLDRPDAGTIDVADRRVAGTAWVQPEDRRIGMVFQDWALFPHLDVRRNVAFGLSRGPGSTARVREVLSLVRLEELGDRMPHELSGGQQQRVAIARALAPAPDVLLLDEPFSNLDAQLRTDVRNDVRRLQRETGTTAVFVTHDQEEALSVADRIAVMASGRVLQIGAPHDVYGDPLDLAVASLVGRSNLVSGTVSGGTAATPLGMIPAPGQPDGSTRILLRPESIALEPDPLGDARVVHVEFYGHDQMARAQLSDGSTIEARLIGAHPEVREGVTVRVALSGPPTFYRLSADTIAPAIDHDERHTTM